jgi:hypothetical protein
MNQGATAVRRAREFDREVATEFVELYVAKVRFSAF